MVPPLGIEVDVVKERVTNAEALPAIRWDEAIPKITELT